MRLLRSYDINQIDAAPILPSFLIMQQNVAARCSPSGANCPAGVTGRPVPLVTSGTVAASFADSSTSLTDLAQNAAGNMAGRVEQTTSAAQSPPDEPLDFMH